MGMYTELNVSMNLKLDKNTLEVLRVMVGEREMGADIKLPDAPLFSTYTQRWNMERVLNIRCDLKNYEDEIELFLNWIYGYATTRGFVGYMRYEEDSDPTLIYFTEDGVKYIPTVGVN